MKWLEPSIEKGIDKTFDLYVNGDKYHEINKKIKDILNEQTKAFNVDSIYIELEGLFLSMSASSVEHSYRIGFEDAMNICPLHMVNKISMPL